MLQGQVAARMYSYYTLFVYICLFINQIFYRLVEMAITLLFYSFVHNYFNQIFCYNFFSFLLLIYFQSLKRNDSLLRKKGLSERVYILAMLQIMIAILGKLNIHKDMCSVQNIHMCRGTQKIETCINSASCERGGAKRAVAPGAEIWRSPKLHYQRQFFELSIRLGEETEAPN